MNKTIYPRQTFTLVTSQQNEQKHKNVQFRLCHIDKYQNARKIIKQQHSISTYQKSHQPILLSKKIPVRQLKPLSKRIFIKNKNYEESPYLSNHKLNLSQSSTKCMGNSKAQSTLHKRYSTEIPYYRDAYSFSKITKCDEEPHEAQMDLIYNSISDKKLPAKANQPKKCNIRKSRFKKVTINELIHLKNQSIREYQSSKLTRMDIIPDYITYSKKAIIKKQRLLVKNISEKIFFQYKILPHFQALNY